MTPHLNLTLFSYFFIFYTRFIVTLFPFCSSHEYLIHLFQSLLLSLYFLIFCARLTVTFFDFFLKTFVQLQSFFKNLFFLKKVLIFDLFFVKKTGFLEKKCLFYKVPTLVEVVHPVGSHDEKRWEVVSFILTILLITFNNTFDNF